MVRIEKHEEKFPSILAGQCEVGKLYRKTGYESLYLYLGDYFADSKDHCVFAAFWDVGGDKVQTSRQFWEPIEGGFYLSNSIVTIDNSD